MWAYPHEDCYVVTDSRPSDKDLKTGWAFPLSVIGSSLRPYDRATQEAMIEMGAKAAYAHQLATCVVDHAGRVRKWHELPPFVKELWYGNARACLAAFGLVDKT